MKLVIELPEDVVARLESKAKAAGFDLATFVLQILKADSLVSSMRGSLKGTGILKELMEDRKREREL